MPAEIDTFISDGEEELCPLCVEEMDLSDKNFKPCPCGYQVCQFCYNNIRQNPQLNGLCPACRRPYSDETVEYRAVSTEEWRNDHLKHARRERERKQREREKKESDHSTRKHLSGVRVIQKNLVYVIGLNPNIPTDELHHTLRGEQFFGQYGRILKIVINKRTNANGHPGLGVYVTFARREDAAKCIAAVDGSLNDGKYLRAAYGTTKYCSSYLRGVTCPNPHCMFLHEPGEDADSFSRQDLSTAQHNSMSHSDRHTVSKSVLKSSPRPCFAASGVSGVGVSGVSAPAQSAPALPATAHWAARPSSSGPAPSAPATYPNTCPNTRGFLDESLDLLSKHRKYDFSVHVLVGDQPLTPFLIASTNHKATQKSNHLKESLLTLCFPESASIIGLGKQSNAECFHQFGYTCAQDLLAGAQTHKKQSGQTGGQTSGLSGGQSGGQSAPPGLHPQDTKPAVSTRHELLAHLMNGAGRDT